MKMSEEMKNMLIEMYESQYEYVTTENVDLSTEGDNASAEYNDVEGNQYNDSSTHNEGGAE